MCLRWFRSLCRTVKEFSGATERREGQVEDLKMYSSYQYAVGLDGELIAKEVKNYAMKSKDIGRPGSEEKWFVDSTIDGTAIQRDWSYDLQKVPRILKQRRGRCLIFFLNRELLFQTVRSVNQFSVYGAVAKRCYHFGLTEEEEGRAH